MHSIFMCNMADVQAVILFMPHLLKHIFCDILDGCGNAPSQFWQHRWKWSDVNTVLDITPLEKSHTVRSSEQGGCVQKVLSAAVACPIHRPGRCRLRYPRRSVCQFGGAPSCWKMNPRSSLSMSSGINQFSNMYSYMFPLIVFSTKKKK